MEKDNHLILLKFGKETFLREVTAGVKNGKPVLVQDVEEYIDPAIDPILLKQQFSTDGGMAEIRLGDATVDFDEHFNLFMTTKMPNPHYIPEICIKVTLINFTVTMSGLEQQLLADVVIAEKPEIEKQRDTIVVQMAKDQKTLKDTETMILKLLDETTTEQILDEDKLIDILSDSKVKSTEINARMEQAKIVEVEVNETRAMYIPVAIRGSILYFVIADLSGINFMYQNSLDYIKQLFKRAIADSPPAPTIDERLATLIDRITKILYTNVSRGLFEADKLIYSMLIAASIKKQKGELDMGIWNAFLRGPTVMTDEEKDAQPKRPKEIGELLWDTLYSAEIRCNGGLKPSEDGKTPGVTQHVKDNMADWEKWAMTDNPYSETVAGDFEKKLSNFDKLLLVRILRSEKVTESISQYIIKEME
jgi:dynein heavy chain